MSLSVRQRRLRHVQREMSVAAFSLAILAVYTHHDALFAGALSMTAANGVVQAMRVMIQGAKEPDA